MQELAKDIVVRGILGQHLLFGCKEHTPALCKLFEERLFMFKKFVVALVKPVDFRQAEVSSQKISQRTLVKPVTVETPLPGAMSL